MRKNEKKFKSLNKDFLPNSPLILHVSLTQFTGLLSFWHTWQDFFLLHVSVNNDVFCRIKWRHHKWGKDHDLTRVSGSLGVNGLKVLIKMFLN